jgi:hypothetical protein
MILTLMLRSARLLRPTLNRRFRNPRPRQLQQQKPRQPYLPQPRSSHALPSTSSRIFLPPAARPFSRHPSCACHPRLALGSPHHAARLPSSLVDHVPDGLVYKSSLSRTSRQPSSPTRTPRLCLFPCDSISPPSFRNFRQLGHHFLCPPHDPLSRVLPDADPLASPRSHSLSRLESDPPHRNFSQPRPDSRRRRGRGLLLHPAAGSTRTSELLEILNLCRRERPRAEIDCRVPHFSPLLREVGFALFPCSPVCLCGKALRERRPLVCTILRTSAIPDCQARKDS